MSLIPKDRTAPLIEQLKAATLALANAHVAAEPEFPSGSRRTGVIAATRVGSALVVSATGECADDLGKLLVAALLADPERV